MNKSLLLSLVFLIQFSAHAQPNKTFFLGHSLVNFIMPNMVKALSDSAGQIFDYDANIVNGAPLKYHYQNPQSMYSGDSWDTTFTKGGFENFIFTEAVPLMGHLTWNDSHEYADTLSTYGKLYNPNMKMYVYETWHCTSSGDGSTGGVGGYPCSYDPGSNVLWRTRLTNDLPLWESIADSLKNKYFGEVFLIPAGQALGRLSDSIDAGAVPGLTSIKDLFTDDIHLSNAGNYFIACVMYSVIHKSSPFGLPNRLNNEYGIPYTVYPTPAQAVKFQTIAFATVCDYIGSGVFCSPFSLTTPGSNSINNPLQINNYTIYNLQGAKIWTAKSKANECQSQLQTLPQGIYILDENGKRKLVHTPLR